MPPQTLVHGQPTRPGHVFSLKRGRQAFQTPPGHENAPFRGWLTGSLYTRRAFRVRNAVRRAVRTPEGLFVYKMQFDGPFVHQRGYVYGTRFEARRAEAPSGACREGGAMRRPGGTRRSEAETACPWGQLRSSGVRGKAPRMRRHLHKKKLRRLRRSLFLWR